PSQTQLPPTQCCPGSQLTGTPPPQTPPWQVSPVVQALPSLQGVPLAAGGLEQTPVAASHVPTACHWSEAVQTMGSVPTQAPRWQESVWVQASPSLHAVPSGAGGSSQAPVAGLHVPAT